MTKKRLLIIGCGDIALRAVQLMRERYRIYGLIRDSSKATALRALGIIPIIGDLDYPATLHRLAGLADLVLHTAPPPNSGKYDRRTTNLLNALGKGRMVPQRIVYISTSGVYGNCAGQLVPETRTLNPQTPRAIRRQDAEQQIRGWGQRHCVTVCILRAPGIYAADRLPIQRIKASTPALIPAEDCFTNHIHADDLARIACIALYRGKRGRSYNVTDDCPMKMGDYFDLVADHSKLPRPPRISYNEAKITLPPSLLSFMGESRRLVNTRLYKELRVGLRYSSVQDALEKMLTTQMDVQ